MNDEITLPQFKPAGNSSMKRNSVAIVGASETTELGKFQICLKSSLPDRLNAIADAGLKLSDIDGCNRRAQCCRDCPLSGNVRVAGWNRLADALCF